MWIQSWRRDSMEQIYDGEVIGWASSLEDAQEHGQATLLPSGLIASIEEAEDYLDLIENYWWPEDWPTDTAYCVRAVEND